MRKTMIAGLVALSVSLLTGCAQQEPIPDPVTVSETSSKPGQYSKYESVKITARVTAIDPATRTVTLKGSKGKTVDVICGDEVKNFDQIKLNDYVVVTYMRALSLQLRKGKVASKAEETVDVSAAPKGQKPGAGVSREVSIVADVVRVDKKKKIISLKGPQGKVVDLNVKNPEHFKVVKVGDKVEVDYVEAMAISVEPVKKKK